MPGKAHVPDLVERLIRGQRAGTPRTAGGFARGASPQMVRDRIGASLKGGGLGNTVQRSSMIDAFEIVDDTDDVFTLTYAPLFDSWNVSLGWPLENVTDYAIAGRTLTIGDPADIFRGIADNGPRILQVQYDYLTGVPHAPVEAATFPQTSNAGEQTDNPTVSFASSPAAGSSVLLAFRSKFGPTPSSISGLGATWTAVATSGDFAVWLGAGCDGSGTLISLTSDDCFWIGIVEVTTPLTATGVEVVANTNANLAALTADGNGVCISLNRAGAGMGNTPSGWTQIGNGTGGSATLRAFVIAASTGEDLDVHTNGVDDWDRAVLAMVRYA